MLRKIAETIKNNAPAQEVAAHCDGPCGVYDPSSARIAAEAVGAKLVSYTGLRGPYDFLAVFEGTFAQGAGIKMATEASGALCDIAVCEAININEVAVNAAKIAAAYKGPGK